MMRSVRALFSALLLTSSLNPAFARGNHTLSVVPYSGVNASCPMGVFPDDGCTGSNLNAQVQHPDAFQPGGWINTLAKTPANYMATTCGPFANLLCRPLWNVAGVDYPVGSYSPIASTCTIAPGAWTPGSCLMDPQLHPPAGCTVLPTGVSTSTDSYLNCNGAAFAGVIQHYNFGNVNGHNCTGLHIQNASHVSTLLIDDVNYFNNDAACAQPTGNDYLWLYVRGIFPGGVTVSNSTIDFNSVPDNLHDRLNGPCPLGARCNAWNLNLGTNVILWKYNAFLDTPGDFFGGVFNSSTAIGGQTFQFNLISGWMPRAANGHKEMYAGQNNTSPTGNPAGVQDHLVWDHNTIVNTNITTNFGPTLFYLANGYGIAITHGPVWTNNTIVEAYVGGRPLGGVSFTGCVGTSYDVGAARCVSGAHNNILFVKTESGPVGYGASLSGRGSPSNCGSNATYVQLPGPYPAGVVEEYGIDQPINRGIQQYYPEWAGTFSGNCSGLSGPAEISNGAIINGHGEAGLGSPLFNSNFLDVSSFGGGTHPIVTDFLSGDLTRPGIPSFATVTASISGNQLTITSGQSAYGCCGYYVYAANIPGCAVGSIHTCPRLLTKGTSPLTLDRILGSPIASESMQIWALTWCVVPVSMANNRDMTGLIPDSWLNQPSLRGEGC